MIFLQNVNDNVIKRKLLSGYNFINNVNISPDPSTLSFTESTSLQHTLLMDNVTKSALMFKKIDINLFIDPDFDISAFRETDVSKIQLPELTPDEVNKWNGMLKNPVVSLYENNFSSIEKYDMNTLKKFAVFCRLLGFFDLDITDVNLTPQEGVMTITVNNDHLVYSGSVEIKTW